jgi:hypothetical protein
VGPINLKLAILAELGKLTSQPGLFGDMFAETGRRLGRQPQRFLSGAQLLLNALERS